MTKRDIVNRMSEETGFTKGNAAIAFDAVASVLHEFLAEGEVGDVVAIPGVGRFLVQEKPARVMHDFNGQKLDVPARKNVKFALAGKLKKLYKAEAAEIAEI